MTEQDKIKELQEEVQALKETLSEIEAMPVDEDFVDDDVEENVEFDEADDDEEEDNDEEVDE